MLFSKEDFTVNGFQKGDYENCRFENCDFSSTKVSDSQFTGCEFENCNLSLANLSRTAIRDVRFINCKMLGIRFDTCNTLGFSPEFEHCLMDNCAFYKVNLKKVRFLNCRLHEADFAEANCTQTVFADSDLLNATFEQTNLEKADLRTAIHYLIHPESNQIKGAKFSLSGVYGLLARYGIVVDDLP